MFLTNVGAAGLLMSMTLMVGVRESVSYRKLPSTKISWITLYPPPLVEVILLNSTGL